MKKVSKVLCCCLIVCFAFSFVLCLASCSKSPVKNLIYIIGDGMGFNHVENAKLYMEKDKLNFENYYVGEVTTYCADSDITDSAASATALATGKKTNLEHVGLDPNGKKLQNIMELSKARGKRTAIVTTDSLDGATPAGFSAHAEDRDKSIDIIKSQASGKVDLLIGRWASSYAYSNLKHFTNNGFAYAETLDELTSLTSGKIVGNIQNVTSTYDPSAEDAVSLKSLVEYALEYLTKDNKKGFTLMVEGAYIDKYSHEHDVMGMIYELMDLNDAVDYILEWASKRDDTAIIFTADHETCGLTKATDKNSISDSLYTATYHTAVNVPLYLYNITTEKNVLDNTEVYQLAKKVVKN